jgi:L-aminopeptidase/D-esterase-like protein
VSATPASPGSPARSGHGPVGGLTDVEGIRVGHGESPGGGSGCTVILGPFRARVEASGMASATRELATLAEEHVTPQADALLLTGGSAFGLAAADGVMAWLTERGQGYPTSVTPVPIVPTVALFDLAPGVGRPGVPEGRRACEAAGSGPVVRGRVGAGAGARVGKLLGREHSAPGGVGSSSGRLGQWVVAALAVVNALGEVADRRGERVAGPAGTQALLARGVEGEFDDLREGENTTLGVVATDAPLSARDLARVLRVAATALPRRISPAYTPFDGDVVFGITPPAEPRFFSSGDVLSLGTALREELEDAILDAVRHAPGSQ